MQFIKRSNRTNPRLSLILLDWSVRESFHLLHYLARQDVPRDRFEVIFIEYYSRVSEAIRPFEEQVDTWVTLGMPEECYYHKHLMYNAGIVLASGDICVICDSDAMVKEGFIRAIIEEFEKDLDIVLHLDQFRNSRKDFYPFNYPSFEEVLGKGCINNAGGKTFGLIDTDDPLHSRNYGSCMCARRDALIEIGGADEHLDFLGHICGPYDMTFRLANAGRRELWHQSEFMYHTWHPGQAGVDNYLGPHDGRHMSSTSLDALATGRVSPLVENQAIRLMREGVAKEEQILLDALIRSENRENWLRERVESGLRHQRFDGGDLLITSYAGFVIHRELEVYYAHLALDRHCGRAAKDYLLYVEADSLEAVKAQIDRLTPQRARWIGRAARFMYYAGRGWEVAWRALRSRRNVGTELRRILGKILAVVRRRRGSAEYSLSDSMRGLLANLYYLQRAAARSGKYKGEPILLVERPFTQRYLKVLRAIGAIQNIRIELVDSTMRVDALFKEASRVAPSAWIVLSRGLYLRCYPLIAEHSITDRLIVV